MKYIIKQSEPVALTEWKTLENVEWKPTYDKLRGTPKYAVKKELMAEQGGLCCYCERRLVDNDSHIEHFRPQHDPTVDALDYNNMLCSCQDHLKKGEPLHCGNLKAGWFDDVLLISPLNPECENKFAFMGNGSIKPKALNDTAAATTIKRLGLDIQKLNDLRSSAIEPFLQDDLSEEDRRRFITGYLQKENGMFNEFWTTIKYVLKDMHQYE